MAPFFFVLSLLFWLLASSGSTTHVLIARACDMEAGMNTTTEDAGTSTSITTTVSKTVTTTTTTISTSGGESSTPFDVLYDAIARKLPHAEVSGRVVMAGEFPVIGHEMVIEGKGNATLDAAEWEFRPFVVRGRGAKLTLKNLQLYKGQAPLKSSRAAKRFPPLADGGSVLVYDGASLEMHNVFVNHSKSWRGAAIAAYGASKVTVVGCRFLNNYAWYAGGGIYLAEGSNASVFNCSFERNKGSEEGGAIAVTGGSYLRSERTTYRRNTGKREGGAGIMVEHPGSVVISIDDLFFENKGVLPSAVGGAILVRDNGTLFVSGSRFVRNRARGGKGNTIFVEEGGIIGRLTNGPTEKDVEWPSNQPKPDMPMGMTTETENNAMATEAMAMEMETMEKKAMAMESTTTIGSQSLPPPRLLTGRKLRWSLDIRTKESANEPAKELTWDKGTTLMVTPDSQPLPPLPGLP